MRIIVLNNPLRRCFQYGVKITYVVVQIPAARALPTSSLPKPLWAVINCRSNVSRINDQEKAYIFVDLSNRLEYMRRVVCASRGAEIKLTSIEWKRFAFAVVAFSTAELRSACSRSHAYTRTHTATRIDLELPSLITTCWQRYRACRAALSPMSAG